MAQVLRQAWPWFITVAVFLLAIYFAAIGDWIGLAIAGPALLIGLWETDLLRRSRS